MAIIYTYPKLTSPQGNELIVVSDVNNRNSTRLITIASIAALVPSGGGCGTAITGIIDLNDDPLYEATLCNDVRFTSIDGSVSFSSTAGNDGVDFSVITPGISCASPTELGGVKISSQFSIEEIPVPVTDDFKVVPVETSTGGDPGDECTAIVRIPEAEVACATSTRNGTIKVGAGLADTSSISNEGEYYTVQVDNNCLAAVRIPSSTGGCDDVWKTITNSTGSGTITANGCDSTLTISSGLGTIDVTFPTQDSVNLDVTSIPCTSTTTVGGIKIAAVEETVTPVLDGGGIPYGVEVNEDCEAFVRVPTTTGVALNGFSPLDIYSGTGAMVSNFTIAQQTISDINLTGVNAVDFVSLNDNANRTIQCHVWQGKMNDSGAATFLGSGSLTGVVKGINTIDLSSFSLLPGSPIVIYFTADKVGDGTVDTIQILVGDGVSGADFLCQSSSSYTASPSNSLTTALVSLSDADEFADRRVACHFYKS